MQMNDYVWHIIWAAYSRGGFASEAIGDVTLRNYMLVNILGESWWGKRIGMRRFGAKET